MQARIDPTRPLREVPTRQRRALAKPLADDGDRWLDRDRAMAEAYRTGAYSMQGIADDFGVSRMTVSRAVKRHEDVSATQDVTCETCYM
jgi:putative transposase